MTPSRKPPYVRVRISIDATLNALFENLPEIWDPVLQKPRYGERSKIISDLMIKYLEGRGIQVREQL